MPPSLSITSWILAGIDSTRLCKKSVSAVLWSQTRRMAAFHWSLLVQLWFLMVAEATPALQSSTAALLESVLKFFLVCDCWVSIAVLCQEIDVGFNLYRLASDEKFSSQNGEISYSSSHIHALLVQKIWGFYLVQEKSYWRKKTGQYFPRILYCIVCNMHNTDS